MNFTRDWSRFTSRFLFASRLLLSHLEYEAVEKQTKIEEWDGFSHVWSSFCTFARKLQTVTASSYCKHSFNKWVLVFSQTISKSKWSSFLAWSSCHRMFIRQSASNTYWRNTFNKSPNQSLFLWWVVSQIHHLVAVIKKSITWSSCHSLSIFWWLLQGDVFEKRPT